MKKKYLGVIIGLSFLAFNCFAQAGEWTWINGSNTSGSAGNYGIQGVPSVNNEPPALYEPADWTDTNGNFWIYGGIVSGGGIANDLWKYDPITNIWTWISGTNTLGDTGNFGVQGVPSLTNRPPGIGFAAASWVDKNGNFWIFGGWNSNPYGYHSALWKYDVGANEWTWMKGPTAANLTGVYGTRGVPDTANYPWSRTECSSAWTDNAGDLWLFSGGGTSGFNDLWRYNIASNTWTWMKGSNTGGKPGVYGTLGVEDSANTPGGRESHSRWKDKSGNLYEFGGYVGNAYNANDFWRYDPTSNDWAWIGGAGTTGTVAGVYGTKCVTAATNYPGPRYENRSTWTDANDNFWMFGGDNYDDIQGNRYLNDLWMYCVASNQWTWVSGDNTYNSAGSWGTLNVASPSNKPNGRAGAVGWRDNNGNLYLFGGTSGATYVIPYNDMWKFTIDPTCGAVCSAAALPIANFQASDTIICSNDCISFTDKSISATSWQWYFSGASPSSTTDQNPQSVCYLNSGIYNVRLVVSNSGGTDSITFSNYIKVSSSPPTPTIIQSNDTLFCSLDTSYNSFQWFDSSAVINGATSAFVVVHHSGNYNVKVSNKIGCSTAVGITVYVGIKSLIDGMPFTVSPNPAADELVLRGGWEKGTGRVVIYNMLGEKVQEKQLQLSSDEVINIKSLSSGVYFIQVQNKEGSWVARFVKSF